MVVVILARYSGAEKLQLRFDHGKMAPRNAMSLNERDTRLFGHGTKTLGIERRLGVCMNIKIGVFAVEKAQLLFKNFKVSVRNDKPCVAHEKHPFRRFHYTEHRRESQSARPRRRGEAH